MFAAASIPAFADTVSVNFENPPYTLGVINGQDGWSSLGAAGLGCAVYDHAVSPSLGTVGFGDQSLRISNAVTSGCFSDQTFSKSLIDEAGETSAVSDGWSGGTRQNHFEAQFSLASAVPDAVQTGLYMSVAPDRGDGARMSYLRFEDRTDGIHVFFDDYKDVLPFGSSVGDSANGCGVGDDFTDSDIATLTRSPHTIKFVMDFVDGPRNDIVKIYIDGALKATGTSWEDYFRYCEGNPTRPVDSMLFRSGGPLGAAPETLGKGFLIDNLTLTSKTLLAKATGGLTLKGNPRQQVSFNAFDYGAPSLDEGNIEYSNFDQSLHYNASLFCAKVYGNSVNFAYQIPPGNFVSGTYVVMRIQDLGTPGTKGDTFGFSTAPDQNTAINMCESGTSFNPSNTYGVTGGNAVVHK